MLITTYTAVHLVSQTRDCLHLLFTSSFHIFGFFKYPCVCFCLQQNFMCISNPTHMDVRRKRSNDAAHVGLLGFNNY